MKNKKSGIKIYIVIPAIVGFLCVAAIVAALIFGVPAKVKAARIGKQLDLGNKYLASADYDNAEVTFNKVLKIDPKSAEAATGMAKVYNKKQEPEKALKYLEMASDNLESPSQMEELRWVADDMKTQINHTGESSDKNRKSLKKIEKIIKDVMLTPIPTPETEESPTPTEEAPDVIYDDDDDDYDDDNDHSTQNGSNDGSIDVTPAPDGIIPLPGEDTLTPIPEEKPELTDTPPDAEPGNADNAYNGELNTGEEDTMDYDEGDVDGSGEEEIEKDTEENSDDIDTDADTENNDKINDTEVTQEVAVSPEELLNNYENNNLSSEVPYGSFSGTQIAYDYENGAGASAVITGRITESQRDLDGDGIPELLVVEMQSGRIAFRIYKVNNGAVEMTASQTISTGMETALEDFSYGNTQSCFVINNNGICEIGLASYCYGYDSGEGVPAVRTYVEVYSVVGDGGISLCASGSVQNGNGQDGFASSLAPAGMNGSFNSSNAETLQSMGYAENPYQDAAEIPNPLSGGVNESGAENLAIVDEQISAGSGTLTVR